MDRAAKILVVDAQPVYRAGLKAILSGLDNIDILEEASGCDLLKLIKVQNPDILIIDDHTASFNEEFNAFLATVPECRLIVVTKDGHRISGLLNVCCYLHRECQADDITEAIFAILHDLPFVCSRKGNGCGVCPLSNLTSRETEIIRLIAHGRSNKEIANELHISPHTVHSHRKNILKKLKVSSASAVTAYAHRAGIV